MNDKQANEAIGARVREARLMRGLNQSALAGAIGCKTMAVSKKETGQNIITALQLARISKKLRKPVRWFLEDVE